MRKLFGTIYVYFKELGSLTPIAFVTAFLPMLGSAILILPAHPLGNWLRENWEIGTPLPRPMPGLGEVLIRVTLTTICGTDLHIVRGEYPVSPGLVIGHEAVGVIEEIGAGVSGYFPLLLEPNASCIPDLPKLRSRHGTYGHYQ